MGDFPSNAPWWLVLAIAIVWATRELVSIFAQRDQGMRHTVMEWAEQLREDVTKHKGEIEQLQKEIDQMKGEMYELRRKNKSYKAWATALVGQLHEAGVDPVPFRDYDIYGDTD